MLVDINDPSVFAKFEQYEAENPAPRKELDGRTIYMSRPIPLSKGLPVLSGLSEARFGNSEHTDLIMLNVYRAPEVILGMPWSYPVDTWALGMVVSPHVTVLVLLDACTIGTCSRLNLLTKPPKQIWDLFEGNHLFAAKDQDNRYSEPSHLAKMISILGPAPLHFLQRSENSRKFWHQDGVRSQVLSHLS